MIRFVLYYLGVLGVSFEAVHNNEIDSWCFLAAISKYFSEMDLYEYVQ